ncbi:hypothetical protein FRC19_005186 [Serendipita sp. 401]|nr:hypothetical protein FRC19_005186 [Serendipita sp. 401]
MHLSSTILALVSLALSSHVAAHSTFQEFWVGSQDMAGTCIRIPLSNSPVTIATSTNMACNVTPSASQGLCTVQAGQQVTVEMHTQPGDRNCAVDAISGNHNSQLSSS